MILNTWPVFTEVLSAGDWVTYSALSGLLAAADVAVGMGARVGSIANVGSAASVAVASGVLVAGMVGVTVGAFCVNWAITVTAA